MYIFIIEYHFFIFLRIHAQNIVFEKRKIICYYLFPFNQTFKNNF